MSESVKMTGKNVNEATEAALEVLRASREEVEVRVISEGEGGILGIGAKPAEVEVWIKRAMGEEAKEILRTILDKMGFLTLVDLTKEDEDAIYLDIRGEDMGRIIGRRAATIDALQFMTAIIMNKKHGRRIRVLVDAGEYRKRREDSLKTMTREAIEKVKSSGKETELEPMTAAERRIVHLAAKDDPEVISYSKGERDSRRVVISPPDKMAELKEKMDDDHGLN